MRLVLAANQYDAKNGMHYLYLLLGQLGEQLLETLTSLGLKARMTPAISETKAKLILKIDSDMLTLHAISG